jgi:geranylgeranyl pyrophosphate synthase
MVIFVEWMNGIQFYLHRDVPIAHGHVIHIDSEWALTSVSQLQFWRSRSPDLFGDSDVRGVLSVDVSDWENPGSNDRSAMQCSREEVVREVWAQLKRSINAERELLRDEDLHSWYLDPDIQDDPTHSGFLQNAEPLLVNLIDTWTLRPEATTAIPNLFLASDYVRTYTDLATMEGANEAARRAVNGILDAAKFDGARCEVWPLDEPEILAPWRLHDAGRYAAGLPWDDSLMQVAAHAIRNSSPLLEQARPLLEAVAPFVSPVADALDLSDGCIETINEVRTADQAAKVDAQRSKAPASAVDVVGPRDFLERLGWYRDMLADNLAAGIPRREPQRHLYGLVKDFIDRSGKGLRPALCLATVRALGGNAENALPAAAGLEMLHNAFLVHDDIENGSVLRRGAVTMHRRVGIPIAVNVGDAMNALAVRFFRKSVEALGPAAALRILDEVDHMQVESLEGQATELGWVRDNHLTVGTDEYLRLVLKKTARYSFTHPMRIGALVADAADTNLDRFDRFGYLLGAAFQITDDVLNLVGDVGRYGNEIDCDLWEGERTILLAHALSHVNQSDRTWISGLLARQRERRLPREGLRFHRILADSGSIAWAQESAMAFAKAAAREFHCSAFAGVPASSDLQWLRDCAEFSVQRKS